MKFAHTRTGNKFFPRVYGSPDERFLAKISPEPNSGCWIWGGDSNGSYGSICVRVEKKSVRVLAHRYAYELFVGPIAKGLQVDHRCGNKLCVNPQHLRLTTPYENTMAVPVGMRGNNQIKTHCRHGHALEGDNLAFDHRGHAKCRTCQARAVKSYREKYARRRLSTKDKAEILAAYCTCACGCGRKLGALANIDFDHILAMSLGGHDTNDNMQPLLRACHKQKTFGPGGDKRITTAGSDANRRAKERKRIKRESEVVQDRSGNGITVSHQPDKTPPRSHRFAGWASIRSRGFDKRFSRGFDGKVRAKKERGK